LLSILSNKLFLYGILLAISFTFAFFQGQAYAAPVPTTHTLHAIKIGHFDAWSAYPVASSKVKDVNSADGDTSYIVRSSNSKRQTFGFKGAGLPTDGSVTIQSVSIVSTSKAIGTKDSTIQLIVEKGTGDNSVSDGPLFTPSKNSYSQLVRTMTKNPFTGNSWTVWELNNMKQENGADGNSALNFGVNNPEQQNIEVRTTEIDLQITFLDTKASVITGVAKGVTK
jgi:hypothetical protein